MEYGAVSRNYSIRIEWDEKISVFFKMVLTSFAGNVIISYVLKWG